MKKIKDSLKYVKLKDILAIATFIFVLIPSLIFKLILKIKKKNLYIICEDPNEASDNGYHLFKYVRENHPNENFYYAINKKAKDYNKIKKYGNIIQFGSIKHWIYYLASTKNISTHKYGNPNTIVFYVLHVMLGLFNNRVFLQHGVIMNDLKFLYYKETKFKQIFCTAIPEYEYIKSKFGYNSDAIYLTGLGRFDNLNIENSKSIKNKIVIMPTWRSYLGRETNFIQKKVDFKDTEYYNYFNSLLKNKKLDMLLKENKVKLYFYPHRNMQKYIDLFETKSKNIIIAKSSEYDVQDLLNECDLMITDYSSVSIDFAYMNKPLAYYQFDQDEFRKYHLTEGYFSYDENGFGPVYKEESKIINYIEKKIKDGFQQDNKYEKRLANFFAYRDKNNCERCYNAIIEKK